MSANVNEVRQCCKEECNKILPQWCESLKKQNRKLFQVIATKSGYTC